MAADLTAVTAALRENMAKNAAKVLWDSEQLTPFLGTIEKKSGTYDAGGSKFIQPLHYGDGSSISADFTTAQDKASGSTTGSSNLYSRWEVPAVDVHAVARWKRDVIDKIQGDSALFDLAEAEMKGKMRGIRRDLARFLSGNGYGVVATISGAPTSTTVVISNAYANRIDVGDDLVASQSESGHVLRSATALRVTEIDLDTSATTATLTLSGDPTALSWANGDKLFRKGDRDNSATPTRRKIYGTGGWLPTTAPGVSDSWCGVNRKGIWQLGGLRYNGSGKARKTALIEGANKLFNMGGVRVTHCFTSVNDYGALCDTLDTNGKTVRIDAREFKVSFEGVQVHGAMGGWFPVLPDPFLEPNEYIMGDFKTEEGIYLVYSGDLVNLDDHDGNAFLRAHNAPEYEARMYSKCNLVVAAPGRFLKGYNFGL